MQDENNHNNNSNATLPLSQKPIQLTDNYEFTAPDSYIDSITQDVFVLPVLATDGLNYEANQLAEWLGNRNTSPISGSQLEQKTLIFNQPLYTEIRDFFKSLLEKDHAILTDGKHDTAKNLIQARIKGLCQNDQSIIQLVELCKTNHINLYGLNALPEKPVMNEPSIKLDSDDSLNQDDIAINIMPEISRPNDNAPIIASRSHLSFQAWLGTPVIASLTTAFFFGTLATTINYVQNDPEWIIYPRQEHSPNASFNNSNYMALTVLAGSTLCAFIGAMDGSTSTSSLKAHFAGATMMTLIIGMSSTYPYPVPTLFSLGILSIIGIDSGIRRCVNYANNNRATFWQRHQPPVSNSSRENEEVELRRPFLGRRQQEDV